MFRSTFQGCVGLTGDSAKVYVENEGVYKYLYEVWPTNTVSVWEVGSMYDRATNLSDYANIPKVYGGGGA